MVYSVKIVKDGKETDLEVAADGTLLEADEEMALDSAPEAVQATLAAQAGTLVEFSRLTAGDLVQYEATLEQNGEEREFVLTAEGQITAQPEDEEDNERGGLWGERRDHREDHEGRHNHHEQDDEDRK